MKRIFSADGGGMKGLIVASFLDWVNGRDGFPKLEDFDMYAGTSTGGIIALGARIGLSPLRMKDFYRIYGPEIFKRGPKKFRFFKRNRYNVAALEASLREFFGNQRLQNSKTPCLIPALDWNARVRQDAIFLFDEKSPFSCFSAARATTAAPTYFEAYDLNAHKLVDGGIGLNNPAMAAATHARKLWPREPLEVWSVGTGREPGETHRYPFTGIALLNDIFELALEATVGVANKELERDGSIRFIRYDFAMSECIRIDDARPETLTRMIALGHNPIKRIDTRLNIQI